MTAIPQEERLASNADVDRLCGEDFLPSNDTDNCGSHACGVCLLELEPSATSSTTKPPRWYVPRVVSVHYHVEVMYDDLETCCSEKLSWIRNSE